jgi:hypothetical protein
MAERLHIENHPTFLHFPDRSDPVELPGVLVLPVGTFLTVEGHPHRVREAWFSLDRHGPLDDGMHLYLEETDRRAPSV